MATRVAGRIDQIIEEIEAGSVKADRRTRAFSALPQVPNLHPDATTFLIHTKRAIGSICRLPSVFLGVAAKDNNFDDLSKTLEKAVGARAPVTVLVRENASVASYLIALRN